MNINTSYAAGRLTIYLAGELDHHEARNATRTIEELLDEYLPRDCVLDLSGLNFMDSSGIAVVINALRNMAQIEGKLLLTGISPQPMKVFRASGIDKLVEMKEAVL